jgi:hypothetical protein
MSAPAPASPRRGESGSRVALSAARRADGLYHDMALKADKMQLVSDKRLVSVNIYYAYFGQLNPQFQYSEEQYLAKLDAIARAVNQWGQVRHCPAAPPRHARCGR